MSVFFLGASHFQKVQVETTGATVQEVQCHVIVSWKKINVGCIDNKTCAMEKIYSKPKQKSLPPWNKTEAINVDNNCLYSRYWQLNLVHTHPSQNQTFVVTCKMGVRSCLHTYSLPPEQDCTGSHFLLCRHSSQSWANLARPEKREEEISGCTSRIQVVDYSQSRQFISKQCKFRGKMYDLGRDLMPLL